MQMEGVVLYMHSSFCTM